MMHPQFPSEAFDAGVFAETVGGVEDSPDVGVVVELADEIEWGVRFNVGMVLSGTVELGLETAELPCPKSCFSLSALLPADAVGTFFGVLELVDAGDGIFLVFELTLAPVNPRNLSALLFVGATSSFLPADDITTFCVRFRLPPHLNDASSAEMHCRLPTLSTIIW